MIYHLKNVKLGSTDLSFKEDLWFIIVKVKKKSLKCETEKSNRGLS